VAEKNTAAGKVTTVNRNKRKDQGKPNCLLGDQIRVGKYVFHIFAHVAAEL
jgi:hypothetical protein